MRRHRHALIFGDGGLARLRSRLLADTPDETAAFLLARPAVTASGAWRLLVFETIFVAIHEYRQRSASMVELAPEPVARAMQRARREHASVVFVHTHPTDVPTEASSRDRMGEALLIPAFAKRVGGMPHARLILGPTLTHAALLLPGRADNGAGDNIASTDVPEVIETPLVVMDVGRDLHIHPGDESSDPGSSRPAEFAHSCADTFDRQVRAFGPEGQTRLGNLRVAVVGVGGTGSIVVQQLAHLGVRDFLLVDPDVLERSNLNRVVGATASDIGTAKVDVAASVIEKVHPTAYVECLRADVRDRSVARALLDADFFFACTDSQGSRAVLSQLACQYMLPGIDMGVAIHSSDGQVTHITGRVQMLAPSLACLLCGHVLDPEQVRRELLTDQARAADRYIVGDTVPQPAVISINSAAASLAVTMFLSAVTGIPIASRHQRLRLETGVVSNISTEPAAECPWCTATGALARGDSWPMPGRGEPPAALASAQVWSEASRAAQ